MMKLMTEDDEKEFVNLVLDFAKRKSMTVTNIADAVNKVITYMEDNAVLEKELQSSPFQNQ